MAAKNTKSDLDKMRGAIGKAKGACISRTWKMSDEEKNSLKTIDKAVYFGRYAYDHLENECAISWDVVEVKDNLVTLCTTNIIDRVLPKFLFSDERLIEDNIWLKSDLRTWLNRDLINYIFSPAERSMLIQFEHKASKSEKDFIALPEEIKIDSEKFIATPYAVTNGVSVDDNGLSPRMTGIYGGYYFVGPTVVCILDGDWFDVYSDEKKFAQEGCLGRKWGLKSGIKLMIRLDMEKLNEALEINENTTSDLLNNITISYAGNNPSLITYGPEEFIDDDEPVNVIYRAKRACPSELKKVQVVYIPDGVEEIGDFAFRDCTNLEKIYIPATVDRIGKEAFMGCTKLKSIVIPNCQVEQWAFRESGIESVYCSSSCYIGALSVFRDCGNVSVYADKGEYLTVPKKYHKPLPAKCPEIDEVFDYYWPKDRIERVYLRVNGTSKFPIGSVLALDNEANYVIDKDKNKYKMLTIMESTRYSLDKHCFNSAIGFASRLKATVVDIPDKRWVVELEISRK